MYSGSQEINISIISVLSSSLTDILDVNNISINEMESLELYTFINTLISFYRDRHLESSTVSSQFFRYLFRNDEISYTIYEKIVIRKDDRIFHI